MIRLAGIVVGAALAGSSLGCADLQTVTASPGDLEDYRAFRVAAAEGTRIARALHYVRRHPKGTWASEAHAVIDEEEPRYFERAQSSREGLRRYLADLPDGPHADAALALLVAFGSSMQDAELRDLARRVRVEDAKLETAAIQRRAVGEAILGALGVLLDDDVYGIRAAEAPPKLRALLVSKHAPTWGAVLSHHEDDYYFVLPTRPERESRLMTLETTMVEANGIFVGARLEASDMLVRWTEADQIARLDPTLAEDRVEAQVHVMGRLEGAFERRFPAAACPDLRRERELYHRACNGWEAVVVPGIKAGDKDVIVIRASSRGLPAPRDRKSPP